ncbi:hypothetical protein MKW98_014019 [Papaver atlanticum]|uniref:Uncharacterized protein n=1 Tax=Papaver atlanticum TaxID=357466 RepID=A0AAD4SIN9_9MAGN|nr:hypothetical protein MKW98_014019 [Papaver atlanticum]
MFESRLFDLEFKSDFESDEIIEKVMVLPRQLHLDAGTDAILNFTFLRASSNALLKINVHLVCPKHTDNLHYLFVCPADLSFIIFDVLVCKSYISFSISCYFMPSMSSFRFNF